MSIDFEPTVTTTVEDGHVCANITYTGEQLDAMARELGKQVDAELFARLAMRHGYMPAAILDECQRENAKLRKLARDVCKAAHMLCEAWEGSCSKDAAGMSIHEVCPIGDTNDLCVFGGLDDRMRELGIEVDDG